MYKSITFLEFQKKFSTEKRCVDYIIKSRWPSGFICPHCHSKYATYIEKRWLFQCNNPNCRKQTSITAGTIFEKTRISLVKWFWMLFLITHHKTGISVAELQRFTSIKRYQTCWIMAHKIRKAMANRNSLYKLDGIVETDDTVFGAKNVSGKRGRGAAQKTNVIVSVKVNHEENPVFVDMSVAENMKRETVKQVLKEQIYDGQKVKTDGYRSYHVVKELGHEHERFVIGDPQRASAVLPWVHIMIANAKGTIRGVHHGVSSKYLKYYLAQFCYLCNRRFWFDQLFDRLLTACLSTKTITFAELTV